MIGSHVRDALEVQAGAVVYPHNVMPAATPTSMIDPLPTLTATTPHAPPITTRPPLDYWQLYKSSDDILEDMPGFLLLETSLRVLAAEPRPDTVRPCEDEMCGENWIKYARTSLCLCLVRAGARTTKL